MNDFSDRLGTLLHFGFGYSAMWNNSLAPGKELLFRSNEGATDEMINIIYGITPQIKLNERMSLNMDVSMMSHIRQQSTFDFQPNPLTGGGFSGYYFNLSIGATYYIGKNKTHADWTYTPRLNQADLNRIATLEKQAKEAATKLGDDDKDGVINAVDQEANTPEGSIVDVTGKTIPPVVAPDLMSIDTDGDGFVDGMDECPTVKGTIKGCPEELSPEKDAKTLVDYGILDVMFVKGSYYLNPTYYSILDKVVSFMAENPGKKIGISGHADIDGEDELNNKLSEARVNIVLDYLVSKGANKNGLTISYRGKKETKYTGNTEEIDAANRRVQFSIVR
jgi:OOP family OmpA-OmpF porin